MSRARWTVLAVLALTLVLLPLLPRGGGDRGAIRPAAGPEPALPTSTSLVAGHGRVTPAYQREISRVVASGAERGISRTASTRTLVNDLVRCAVFDGQRYCLGSGWTDHTQAQVQTRLAAAAARRSGSTPTATGDLPLAAALRQQAALSPRARAAAQTAELTAAARSVAKVWLLRHEIEGVPLPAHFFERHPEAGAAAQTTGRAAPSSVVAAPSTLAKGRVKHWRDYPRRGTVLDAHQVTEQHRTYWCGPTTLQMIAWGWSGDRRSQAHWARRLGTTTDGTSITAMVRVVNHHTGWDRSSYAGPYVTLDISDWSFNQWKLLMARHVVDYRAPVILHPVLLARFYPYLDHDGSGHFQVGRGYKKRDGNTPLLGYFEPWDQQRFHPDEPFIDRVQWRNAYRSYRANRAHFQHNLGV